MVDLLRRPEHDAVTHQGVSISERGAANPGNHPLVPGLPTGTAPVVPPPAHAITAAIYAPVSTPGEDQKMPVKLRQLARRMAGSVIEFRERPARANTRPVFSEMMELASRRKFGVIFVESLDCFARSLPELLAKLEQLDHFGVRLVTADGSVDTDKTTGQGPMFLQTLTVLVDAERRMIARKVRAGMERAKSDGVHCGRPRLSFPPAEVRGLREQGLSIRAIGARLGVSATTIAKALKA